MQKKIKRRFSEKNYSLIGKISLERFPIILQKDKIIKGEKKKFIIRDLFHPDQPKEELKTIEDYNNFTDFKLSVQGKDGINNYTSKSKVDFFIQDMKTNPKYFYHNKHLSLVDKLKKLVFESDNLSYAPKYDYVKPRLLTGPNWENLGERKKEKIEYDERDYYIKHDDVLKNTDFKCLVNMKKTTQRIEFVKQKLIKFKNDKKFIPKSQRNKIKKNKNKNKIPYTSRNEVSKEKIYKLFNINPKTVNDIKKIKSKKIKKENHSVDFKKIISREEVEKIKEAKYFKIPFITPNYSLVEDRLISNVDFNIEKNKSNKRDKQNIEGYDYKLNYSPDKYISKINNHIEPQTPNFSYMFHRNGDWAKNSKKNPLPFYMRDIYDRNSCRIMTEKSLKENKFKEGKISLATSSFFPKKSFNRIVNINLIKSKTFKEKTDDEYIEEKKVFLKENIKLRNNSKEIKELKNFGVLDKFENFTYKTIDKRENQKNHNSMKNIFMIAY